MSNKKGTIKDLIKLFKNGDAWCKNVFARNAKNREVSDTSDNAVKFCMYGGFHKINLGLVNRRKIEKKAQQTHKCSLVCFNDDKKTKWTDVKKLLQSCLPKKK